MANKTRRHLLILSPLGLLFCVSALPARTADSALAKTEQVEISLHAEVSRMASGKPFWVALQISHAPQWHTYWLNPGDSGQATEAVWTLPEGFMAGPLLWPVPKRLDAFGLTNYGFEGEIFLLTKITPPLKLAPSQTVNIIASTSWLVCKEVCVPGEALLGISLETGEKAALDPANKAIFSKARSALIKSGEDVGIRARLSKRSGKLAIQFEGLPVGGVVDFVPVTESVVDNHASPKVEGKGEAVTVTIPLAENALEEIEKIEGVVVMNEPGKAMVSGYEITAVSAGAKGTR
jgi:thiol:disulfide interchange protein DsbD